MDREPWSGRTVKNMLVNSKMELRVVMELYFTKVKFSFLASGKVDNKLKNDLLLNQINL